MIQPEQPPAFLSPIRWPRGLGFAALAVAGFHVAYTPAESGVLALGILVYGFGLTQLARLRTARQAIYFTLITGLACYGPQLHFFWGLFGPFALVLWTILAAWLGLFVGLSRLAIHQLGAYRAAFLMPFFWIGLEYFRSELYYLRFSWLNVGYALAQNSWLPWPYLGVYGVGFAIMAGLLAAGVTAQFVPQRTFRRGLVCLGILAGLFALLLPSPSKHRHPTPTLVAAGLQLEFPNEDEIPQLLDRVVAAHQAARATNATLQLRPQLDLIVLPEYTLSGPPPAALREWCRTNAMFLIVGGKAPVADTNYYNTAYVISTNGEIVFQQVKSVPIQFFADGLPAPEQKLWASPWGKIGLSVCYDLSYTRVMDELIKQGAQLLIVPTMDVVEWGQHQHELHARIAPVRAAEYGVPIFRVASSGISQSVDRQGRVQSVAPFPGPEEIVFAGLVVGPRRVVPPDRLLALLSVGVTVIFLGRVGLRAIFRRPPPA